MGFRDSETIIEPVDGGGAFDSSEGSITSTSESSANALAAANSAAAALDSENAAETSETGAATSASTATTKASEASTSASDAATSATNAATSATSAAASVTTAEAAKVAALAAQAAAETAETNAETAETNASTSSTSASNSATAASTSATAAATSATNASTSESSASTSASTATTKASEASTSATNAATSASSASTSASTATTKAGEAATSATAASGSASTATTKASEASTSATAAQTAETNAETAETNAAASASTATTKASEASTSATNAATSATSASGSASTATTKASEASTSATNAATSASSSASSATAAQTAETNAETAETNAAASATTSTTKASEASTSATNAATSATAAQTAETNAETAETNAADSESSASGSASTATTKASEASTSATNAATSATSASTYASTATTKASEASTSATSASGSASTATTKAGEAATSATAAAASETAAQTAETNAETAETNAAASASTATTKASEASTSATNAATSATSSATSATAAQTAETNAETAETNASASSTSASGSASTATTKAGEAATSASSASGSASTATTKASEASASATSASGSATTATTKASEASTSATNAATSATSASSSASTATTKASEAATSATNAATSASTATTKASEASTSATNAATSASTSASSATAAQTAETNAETAETNAAASATTASTKAGESLTSANSSAASATAATAAKDAALAALDSFDDRYLGDKASDPTVDNDGNALVSGALYFNTTDDVMKVYTGSSWVAAYASLSGALLATNNLSDLDNAVASRSNLGLVIGTNVQAFSSILAATTASYTTALNTKLSGIETGATADQTAAQIKTAYENNDNTNEFSDAEQTKLSGIETGADVTDTANVVAALTAGTGVSISAGGEVAVTVNHDNLAGFEANEHIDWTADQGATNIHSGNYVNTTYSNLNEFTNGPGYITDYTVTEADVTGHEAALSITESQISDLGSYLTAHPNITAATSSDNSGRTYIQDITLDSNGHITGIATATETVTDTTYTVGDGGLTQKNFTTTLKTKLDGIAANANNYSHPTYDGDDISVDTGVLTGATVISDLDFNVTTDNSGHVTDANATVSTRNLTLANLGYTGATNANYITNNNQLTNGAGYTTNVGDITGVTAGAGITGGGTSGTVTINHADTSSQASVDNSNGTVIQDITLDTYGHITGISSANLDGRYYTETESDSRFVNVAGDTMTGNLIVSIPDGGSSPAMTAEFKLRGYEGRGAGISIRDQANSASGATDREWFVGTGYNQSDFNIGYSSTATQTSYSAQNKFSLSTSGNAVFAGTAHVNNNQKVFADNYHPNADKWTTARTLSLSGDASGSVSWDGSANATLSVAVADNSHNHQWINDDSPSNAASDALQYLNTNGSTTDSPTTDWYNTIRMGHGNPNTYYNNTLAMQMTGSNVGALYGRTRTNGTAGSWNRFFADNYHPNADKWTTARTLSLSGDATGSFSWDGSANATLSVAVVNDSHTHDGRYYTETEADSRFVNVTGDTMTGTLTIDTGSSSSDALVLRGTSPTLSFIDEGSEDDFYIHVNSNNFYVLRDTAGADIVGTGWDSPHALQLEGDTNIGYLFGSRVFADNYHPNADKWTTARTLTLSGDASGSVSWDGSANATLSVTVSDDSHNHVWGNIDGGSVNGWGGLRHTTTNGYIDFGPANASYAHIYTDRPNFYFNKELLVNNQQVFHNAYHPNADKWTTARTLSLSGDATGSVSWDGSANATLSVTVADNSHNHSSSSGNFTVGGDLIATDILPPTDNTGVVGNSTYTWNNGQFTNLQINSTLTVRGAVDLADNDYLRLGSGDDFRMWHDGTNTYFRNYNHSAGSFYWQAEGTAGVNHNLISMHNNVATPYVRLYYDGSTVLETVSGGVNIPGNIAISGTVDGRNVSVDGTKLDNIAANANNYSLPATPSVTGINIGSQVNLAESSDRADLLQITSSTSSWAGLQIRNSSNEGRWSFMTDGAQAGFYDDENNHWAVQMDENGGVRLSHDNVLRFNTLTDGVDVSGTLYVDDKIVHNGDTDTYTEFHAANQWRVVCGGSERLEVNTTDINVAANLQMNSHFLDMNNNDIYGVDQIFHEGDTDTYMQFHAADQWRVVTGGVERLEVNNSQITSTEPIHAPSFHGDGSSLTGVSVGLADYPTKTTFTSSTTLSGLPASSGYILLSGGAGSGARTYYGPGGAYGEDGGHGGQGGIYFSNLSVLNGASLTIGAGGSGASYSQSNFTGVTGGSSTLSWSGNTLTAYGGVGGQRWVAGRAAQGSAAMTSGSATVLVNAAFETAVENHFDGLLIAPASVGGSVTSGHDFDMDEPIGSLSRETQSGVNYTVDPGEPGKFVYFLA